jgi:hypothetical protein
MVGLTEGWYIDGDVKSQVLSRSRSDQRSALVYRVCHFENIISKLFDMGCCLLLVSRQD